MKNAVWTYVTILIYKSLFSVARKGYCGVVFLIENKKYSSSLTLLVLCCKLTDPNWFWGTSYNQDQAIPSGSTDRSCQSKSWIRVRLIYLEKDFAMKFKFSLQNVKFELHLLFDLKRKAWRKKNLNHISPSRLKNFGPESILKWIEM
jgi:hypothetical protein